MSQDSTDDCGLRQTGQKLFVEGDGGDEREWWTFFRVNRNKKASRLSLIPVRNANIPEPLRWDTSWCQFGFSATLDWMRAAPVWKIKREEWILLTEYINTFHKILDQDTRRRLPTYSDLYWASGWASSAWQRWCLWYRTGPRRWTLRKDNGKRYLCISANVKCCILLNYLMQFCLLDTYTYIHLLKR